MNRIDEIKERWSTRWHSVYKEVNPDYEDIEFLLQELAVRDLALEIAEHELLAFTGQHSGDVTWSTYWLSEARRALEIEAAVRKWKEGK